METSVIYALDKKLNLRNKHWHNGQEKDPVVQSWSY